MSKRSLNDHPSATYRGYRRQALYSLHRLLARGLGAEEVVQPEGKEDLAVFTLSGSLAEVVQVKDHSSPLTFSSLNRAFYRRAAEHIRSGSKIPITIAHYGDLGRDFAAIRDENNHARDRFANYLVEINMSRPDAICLASSVKFEHVDETNLKKDILYVLETDAAGIDLEASLYLLMYWVIIASENRTMLTREDTIKKLTDIGRILAARAAFHDEWHTSIIPLGKENLDDRDIDQLAEEFYRGVRARYEHIAAGLDIPREDLLEKIHMAFTRTNVVVLQGASGQGKTALGYRYCADFTPFGLRYQVRAISDAKHANRIALAMRNHVNARDIPALVFLDVEPGNNEWMGVVEGLAATKEIRVLVTIRQEDWKRTSLSPVDIEFEEIEVLFDVNEARELYERLPHHQDRDFIDFIDAWSQFGERGPLMEFVYFLTQTEMLKERLNRQIQMLRDNVTNGSRDMMELEFLTYVAVATSFEATLDLEGLIQICQVPSPHRTLQLFEKEYLLLTCPRDRYHCQC